MTTLLQFHHGTNTLSYYIVDKSPPQLSAITLSPSLAKPPLWSPDHAQGITVFTHQMEAQLFVHNMITNPLCFSSSSSSPPRPSFFFRRPQQFISTAYSLSPLCHKIHPAKQPLISLKASRLRNVGPVNLSASSDSLSPENTERWLLQPVGDGDTRHIGFKVPMPDAFEIQSSVVTVGRVSEKADLVIPVATVSGLHARIEKKEGSLLVTDLDSTNGTFVNEKRLKPGAATTLLPGNSVTFGDNHLAMFRVSKLENVDLPSKPDESAAPEDTPKTVNEEPS